MQAPEKCPGCGCDAHTDIIAMPPGQPRPLRTGCVPTTWDRKMSGPAWERKVEQETGRVTFHDTQHDRTRRRHPLSVHVYPPEERDWLGRRCPAFVSITARGLSPDEARRIAAMLVAAADEAESANASHPHAEG